MTRTLNDIAHVLPSVDTRVASHFVVGATPEGAMGETHIVGFDDRFFVVTVASGTAQPVLRPIAKAPNVVGDGLSAKLELHQDNGTCIFVELSPFEIADLRAFLLAPIPCPTAYALEAAHVAEPSVPIELDDADIVEGGGEGSVVLDRVVASAESRMFNTIDLTLSSMELIAKRAARRGRIQPLRVTARLNMGIGEIGLEIDYNEAQLRALRNSN